MAPSLSCDDARMSDEHTGGMIALIPRASDQEQLAVRGGDKAAELHLTLVYLGDDVSGLTVSQRNHLSSWTAAVAADLGVVEGRAFAHALFNPDGYADRDPCAVYLIGDCSPLSALRMALQPTDRGIDFPEQHEPFVPHITAGYGIPFARLSYTGPVVFDRLRLALGGEYVDYPLGEISEKTAWDELLEIKQDEITALIEAKIMSPDPRAAKLREYWAHGPGRRKWKTFRALRRQLAKYVHSPRVLNGLTANIYKLATGRWPGKRDEKGLSMETVRISAEECKAAMLLADPDAELPEDMDLFAETDEDEGEDGSVEELSDEEEAYEQSIMNEFDWELTSQGELVPEESDEVDEADEDDAPAPVHPGVGQVSLNLFD